MGLDPLSIIGDGVQAYGDWYQGQANKDVAEYNAQIADQNAKIVEAQGEEAARRSLVNGSKVIGAAEAAYGASGVSGVSVQAVLRNSAAQSTLDALTIKNNADIKAAAFTNEAALNRYRGVNAEKAGDIGAASSLISGVGSIASTAIAGAG